MPYSGHELIMQTKKGREAFENHKRNLSAIRIQRWVRKLLPYKRERRAALEAQIELQRKIDEKVKMKYFKNIQLKAFDYQSYCYEELFVFFEIFVKYCYTI